MEQIIKQYIQECLVVTEPYINNEKLPLGLVQCIKSYEDINQYRTVGQIAYNLNDKITKKIATYNHWKPVYFHILSEDEIKFNDWAYCPDGSINKVIGFDHDFNLLFLFISGAKCFIDGNDYKKVIASTNLSLELPKISEEFLKKYEKKQFRNVLVSFEEYENWNDNDSLASIILNGNTTYKKLLVDKENFININIKEEKKYTELEAKEIAFKCWCEGMDINWQNISTGYPIEFEEIWEKTIV